MLGQVVVGDGDACGAPDGIHQPIRSPSQVTMVDPHVGGGIQRDTIPVRPPPRPHVTGRRHDSRRPRGRDVVDGNVGNDNVAHVLQRQPRPPGDVDRDAAAVDRFVARDHELVLEADGHARLEDDPQRLQPRYPPSQCAVGGVGGVVVARGRHHVDLAVLAAERVAPEPESAARVSLRVGGPVGVAPPTVVGGVAAGALAAATVSRSQRGLGTAIKEAIGQWTVS